MLLAFAVCSAAAVTLGSPANRRHLAAWLIASARAQEELREARRKIREQEREHRHRILAAVDVAEQCERMLQERSQS